MKVGVTGAGGFIGTALCSALAGAGHLRTAPGEPCDAVVHLAGIAHRRASAEELRHTNVDLALQVGRAAAATGSRMIFMSTIKVHGEECEAPLRETSPIAPRDPYAESKARAEEGLRAIADLRLTVLRPPLVYGPGVKANFLALMRAIARGMPLPLASIQNRRSLVYVGNLVDAVLGCLAKATAATYLVADGRAVSTPQLCRAIGEALGRPARLFRFPPALIRVASLARSLEADDSAIRRDLGWLPRASLEDGLRATAAWFRRR